MLAIDRHKITEEKKIERKVYRVVIEIYKREYKKHVVLVRLKIERIETNRGRLNRISKKYK